MPDVPLNSRLPRNFHKTFKPERQYIREMLRFAASGREGDYQEIATATGIPTGTSSGKVPAILDYCRGMGLIRLVGPERSSVKKPELTAFGRNIFIEDPFLKLSVSQWIAHFNLCGPIFGADVWYQTFFVGTHSLGMNFERNKLENHLNIVYGTEKGRIIGPLIGTYEDDAAFKVCGVLTETAGKIERKIAPVRAEMAIGYGAWIIQLMANHFPQQRQISVTELDAEAGLRAIPGWGISSLQKVLELVERKGMIEVDRHMEPWLVMPSISPDEGWKRIYDDLL